jgi:hypothetical protein
MDTREAEVRMVLPCYVLYLYGFFGWGGRLELAPGVVRCIPRPSLGALLPPIEHRNPEIKVADSWLWPVWFGRVGLILVGATGMRHYVGPPGVKGTATWDWTHLESVLEEDGFRLIH